MRWIICPRCELNYIQEGEKLCSVCRKELRGETDSEEFIELCSECGERPVVPGKELCAVCLKEHARNDDDDSDEEIIADDTEPDVGGNDSVSTMEEILPDDDFEDKDVSFDDDDDSDNDEDEDEAEDNK